jgi:hypothetical protein
MEKKIQNKNFCNVNEVVVEIVKMDDEVICA